MAHNNGMVPQQRGKARAAKGLGKCGEIPGGGPGRAVHRGRSADPAYLATPVYRT